MDQRAMTRCNKGNNTSQNHAAALNQHVTCYGSSGGGCGRDGGAGGEAVTPRPANIKKRPRRESNDFGQPSRRRRFELTKENSSPQKNDQGRTLKSANTTNATNGESARDFPSPSTLSRDKDYGIVRDNSAETCDVGTEDLTRISMRSSYVTRKDATAKSDQRLKSSSNDFTPVSATTRKNQTTSSKNDVTSATTGKNEKRSRKNSATSAKRYKNDKNSKKKNVSTTRRMNENSRKKDATNTSEKSRKKDDTSKPLVKPSILAAITPKQAETLVKDCGANAEFQCLASYLVGKKTHGNEALDRTADYLRTTCAYDQDLITQDEELSDARYYRNVSRGICEEEGYTYNGGHLAVGDSRNGGVMCLHYSTLAAAGNIDENDECHRIPKQGPGSQCIMLVATTFPKSCLFEEEKKQNSEAEWPKETPAEVKEKQNRIVIGDIYPVCLDKHNLAQDKKEFTEAMGFVSVNHNGKVIKAMRFTEMMGLVNVIRNVVAMRKHQGKPVPILPMGTEARKVLSGEHQSKHVEGCGESHHPEGIVRASSRRLENVRASDLSLGRFYGFLFNSGNPMSFSFEERRHLKKRENGECLDIDLIKAEAAIYMSEQVLEKERTKEDVMNKMSEELGELHANVYYPCFLLGKRVEQAAKFMREQRKGGKTSKEAIELMATALSPQHVAVYRPKLALGKMLKEAFEFMRKQEDNGVSSEEALKLMVTALSQQHVDYYQNSYTMMFKEANNFMRVKEASGISYEEALQLMATALSSKHVDYYRNSAVGRVNDAKNFMRKQETSGVSLEEALKLMATALSQQHVELYQYMVDRGLIYTNIQFGVVYNTQTLGLKMALANSKDIVVTGVTSTPPNGHQINAGDFLVGLNGKRFEELGIKIGDFSTYNLALDKLRNAQRPMMVMFERRNNNQFGVVYNTQTLGLKMALANSKDIVVTGVTSTPPNGHQINAGDFLVGLNGKRFEELGIKIGDFSTYNLALDKLRNAQRPMMVMFERRKW